MVGFLWVGLAALAVITGISNNSDAKDSNRHEESLFPDDARFVPHGYNKWGYKTNVYGDAIHRVVSAHVDGPIPSGWVVHHVDGNKLNNDPDNLVQMPREMHHTMHLQYGKYVPFSKNRIKLDIDFWLKVNKK